MTCLVDSSYPGVIYFDTCKVFAEAMYLSLGYARMRLRPDLYNMLRKHTRLGLTLAMHS